MTCTQRAIGLALILAGLAQAQLLEDLPQYNKGAVTIQKDWLVDSLDAKAKLYKTGDGKLVLSNGLVSRTFTTTPNGATVALERLSTNESFLRAVRPEAEVVIDGIRFDVGGLDGQPIHNYLLPEWLGQMRANPKAFRWVDTQVSATKARFPWKKRLAWMPKDLPWPAPGKEVVFRYQLDDEAIKQLDNAQAHAHLKDIEVSIHYELYDNMPVFCKWMTVKNNANQAIHIRSFKSEILAATEPESTVDSRTHWTYPNITLETDYNFGGMSGETLQESSVAWNVDPLYKTQVNYERTMPCLLEVYPKYGPAQTVKPGGSFVTYRAWELLNDSWDRERKGLGHRRLMRAIAPWATENPVLMHVRSADDKSVKKAIDQCAEVGFEMVIMTFGSGFNAENKRPENIQRMRALADYAHAKHVALGGYSLLASRRISAEHDVVMPEGKKPRFGNSPCIESEWGHAYFKTLYDFYESTGLDILEHDGSYPGDVCTSTVHPGHTGLDDSQWNQYQRITDFYKWCRSKGLYLNVPDNYFLSGSNKTGMGYRETNWSLPRAQQEIVERQNIYDGTWQKTPSMGWMFVPLVQYHGGGQAATIEPLKDHLPHYGQRLANLFAAGVQACYRGPQLYDAPETKALVTKWVDFYKANRQILDGDIIHVRRPDGRDYDAILHVDPAGDTKGMLVVYNPLNQDIKRGINVNLYYTGLKDRAMVQQQDQSERTLSINRDYSAVFKVNIPAKGMTWFTIR